MPDAAHRLRGAMFLGNKNYFSSLIQSKDEKLWAMQDFPDTQHHYVVIVPLPYTPPAFYYFLISCSSPGRLLCEFSTFRSSEKKDTMSDPRPGKMVPSITADAADALRPWEGWREENTLVAMPVIYFWFKLFGWKHSYIFFLFFFLIFGRGGGVHFFAVCASSIYAWCEYLTLNK